LKSLVGLRSWGREAGYIDIPAVEEKRAFEGIWRNARAEPSVHPRRSPHRVRGTRAVYEAEVFVVDVARGSGR